MFLGALIGFLVGAVTGLSSNDLDAPVLLPIAGAAIGVFAAALVVGVLSVGSARERAAREASEREQARERVRRAAHDGWIDDIDLRAEGRAQPQPRSSSSR